CAPRRLTVFRRANGSCSIISKWLSTSSTGTSARFTAWKICGATRRGSRGKQWHRLPVDDFQSRARCPCHAFSARELFRRRRRARLTGLRRFHIHQLHFENQDRVWRNSWPPLLAVGKICRNEKLKLGADLHQLERFSPTFDNASDWKRGWLAAFVGTVEFSAVNQGAAVVYRHAVAAFRLRAGTFFQHFIL